MIKIVGLGPGAPEALTYGAIKALEDVGLKEQIHKKPNQLSGGQMQRVAIARALVNNPDIILADEPTGALDSKASDELLSLFSEINRTGQTIVMVTHNMQQATRVSDRTVFFLLGEVVEMDKTEKLFSMPTDKRTEDYITGRFG